MRAGFFHLYFSFNYDLKRELCVFLFIVSVAVASVSQQDHTVLVSFLHDKSPGCLTILLTLIKAANYHQRESIISAKLTTLHLKLREEKREWRRRVSSKTSQSHTATQQRRERMLHSTQPWTITQSLAIISCCSTLIAAH